MRFPFLDRGEELARLRSLLDRKEGTFGVLYGRRRCGKSRLLSEALEGRPAAFYIGDDREAPLQRAGLAAEIARLLPGFDRVLYPDWDSLFARWWDQARPGMVLALDEFPALVSSAGEIPSLLQKQVDLYAQRGIHLLLAGSSQRMMAGIVLDRAAPLFGRASEILRIGPLPAGWIQEALRPGRADQAVEAYAIWGGVPRYWELAADHGRSAESVQAIVLSPLGVLHEEPSRLFMDDLRDPVQAASILHLVGQGCHRLSEVAARLGKPATSLSRPLQKLVELGLLRREAPFGTSPREGKKTLYRIEDPFLRFWFRFVAPERSGLETGRISAIARGIACRLPAHVAETWEDLARASVARLRLFGRDWGPAGRWWGTGLDRKPLEIDIVAESPENGSLLLGEASWKAAPGPAALLRQLSRKAEVFPALAGRKPLLALWLRPSAGKASGAEIVTPERVLAALR